jgi:hypothetical protein
MSIRSLCTPRKISQACADLLPSVLIPWIGAAFGTRRPRASSLPAGFLLLAVGVGLAICLSVLSRWEPALAATQSPAKLTAADGAACDGFGYAVALSGDTALVGAYNAAGGTNQNQGAAYVFVRSGGAWSLQQKLAAADGAANDNFGWAVALNGNTAVIGAIGCAAGTNAAQGAVYVFVRNGTMWTPQQKLTASDGAAGDVFGWSVAASGETALVGALSSPGGQRNQGAAYVFARSGAVWTQQQKLTASDGVAGDAFGTAVALNGDTALIGAPDKDSGAQALQGAAYVFTRNGTSWAQQQKLMAGDGAANDTFGLSVALSGETALIGATGATLSNQAAQGSAYVFARSGVIWNQQQKLTASDGAALDSFGAAVALNGAQALVGAPGGSVTRGAAYVFARSGTVWHPQQKLTASDGAAGDAFGNAVTLSGGTALVGAFGAELVSNPDQGAVYSFDLCPLITLTPATLNITTVGVPVAQTLAGNGGSAPYGFALVSGALPDGLTLSSSGTLSGTPNRAGSFNFTVRAADANGCTSFQTYALTLVCNPLTLAPGSLPAGTVGAPYSATTLTASGGAAPYSFSLSAGSLPAGLTLTAAGVLSGTPTQVGSFNFTVQATDAHGCAGTGSFTLVINCQSITVGPASLSAGSVGSAYAQTFTQTGGLAAPAFSLQGTLPAGLTFTAATATLAGVPTQAGSFPLTIKATDANGCAGMQTYTLVLTCPAISLNPTTLPGGTVAAAYSQMLTASGGAGPYSFNLSAGALPNGLTLAANGTLSGTPLQAGAFTLTAQATDTHGCTGTRAYTLNIACPAITVNPASLPVAVRHVAYPALSFTGSGGVGPYSFSLSAGALPAGLNLNNGMLLGAATQSGSFDFTIRATDVAGCTGSRRYTLSVRRPARADFDGDGRTDLGIWRGPVGQWQVIASGSGQPQIIAWGRSTAPYFDVIVPGDYDGDGKADQAIWRGGDSIWYIRRSSDGQPILQLWGASYAPYFDVPTPGDYDGDGKTDLAVFRPANGAWFIKKSSDDGYLIEAWGAAGDTPVAADYDGDGKTDLAVWRAASGQWFIKRSTGGFEVIPWGAGFAPYFDVPVPADYDGDGKADLAIWRGADSIWYLRQSSDGQPVLQYWGANYAPYFDIPVPGDYDGDGKADIAVWRPTNGTWYVLRSSNGSSLIQTHGQQGDTPVPAHGVR